ncbi:MAG: hypothetical protein L0Y44_11235, partial [Phycisphaerales bacterium]|nr:hypothetical protein [Phycisphaerales bacterium]MCI0675074.1 hypothetical protein [Phycisphaerales bacterium]
MNLASGILVLMAGALAAACAQRHASNQPSPSLAIATPDPASIPPKVAKEDEPVSAARFRYVQRLSKDGTIPPNALMRAKQQRDRMVAHQNESGGVGGDGGIAGQAGQWTWLGPGNIGGRIRAIIVHPTQPSTIWIGSASGGIWKTTDAGASWFALDDYMPSLAAGCMAIDPANPDVLYAGTGEGFFETIEGSSNTAALRGAGIFKTTDGGTTWNQLPATADADWNFVNRLAIDPNNNQIILAATHSGIHRSTDAGASWTRTLQGVIYDLQFHPTDSSKLVAGRHDAPPVYSTDGGLSWQGATGATGHRIELRYAPSNPNVVYAGVSNQGAIVIHRSINGGVNYTSNMVGGGIATYQAYNSVLWVDPTNVNHLLVGGISLYRSTNGGMNFTSQFGSVHADHHGIVEHPAFNGTTNKVVYFGNDGGIYRTDDVYGTSSLELNNNLGITQFYGAAVNPSTGVIVGGTQDNGTKRFGGDASGTTENWTTTFGGDGGFCAADPTSNSHFYGEIYWLQIFRSTNGGMSGNYIYQGISDAGTLDANFIPYFMLDPNDPNRMLAAAARLWRSNNVKAPTPTWEVIKAALPKVTPPPGGGGRPPGGSGSGGGGSRGGGSGGGSGGAHFAENSPYNISTIAVAKGDSNNIWVGHNNGQVWKTSDGTAANPSWVRVDDAIGGPSLPDRWISRIVINPSHHDDVHVSIMGWDNDNVWRTIDGGETWVDVTGLTPDVDAHLPEAPVSALAQHRVYSNWLYAGTDIGLFASNNGGYSWFAVTDGLPAVPVDELVWRNDDVLLAVTHGRGIFSADVTPDAGPGDANADGVVNV